ncbi:ATP-binding protein [Pontibacter sp. G13]|uniref:sensor histidine kinase n=1 Tax=Pontibacter sp. G13 TaxID=3074898 RepID=UPI00288C1CB6|nr:ATP-binding protein [Pontibacter sp. G13]WNJ18951.1 ATP-binding protein [Pontibacter sp. G13]
MIFKDFRFNVILRVVLLAAAMAIFFKFVYLKAHWPVTKFFFVAGMVGMVWELIHYLEKTNRDLRNFLLAIKYRDFTHTFSSEFRGDSFLGLKDAFNQIMKGYQDLRAEKESHYLYLQNVIEHVSVALICHGEQGEILLMNQAAKDLLDRPYMSNIKIMDRINPDLLKAVEEIKPGERKLVKALVNDQLRNLALQSTEFKLQEVNYRLVSLQDIRSELEAKEVDTWQKLIRVLTHEIMNSVTPIISLAKVVHTLLEDEEGNRIPLTELDDMDSEDILNSVKTIESRSKGLLHFVHAYRSMTRIQKPNFANVKVSEMLARVSTLLGPEMERRGIRLDMKGVDPSLTIKADGELIEQVLINLVKNAMEAVEDADATAKEISLACQELADGRKLVMVKDTGKGIDPEYQDKVFIPFFTTKKKGSGIGLSLSRQVMKLHGGTISFQTDQGVGTTFALVF